MSTNEAPATTADDVANTLVLGSAFDADRDAICGEELGVDEPGETNVLFVTLTGTPDACLDRWRSHVSTERPANLGVVTVDENSRSAGAVAASESTAGGAVRSVSSVGDLTGLGIAISEYLAEWHDNGAQTVVCFDSLTSLLQYAGSRRVFQFLHVLTRRVDSTSAVAHYHLDPAAHDEQDVRTITSLFDRVRGDSDMAADESAT